MPEKQAHPDQPTYLDIAVVGAGISGINTAYRLQSQLPHLTFKVLEARHEIGGTWDLFRYPGIRSDSDLHTFGFPWYPWPHANPIAEGPLIMSYLKDAVASHGLGKYIRLNHKVLSANWSSKQKLWTLAVETGDGSEVKLYTARFLVLGTGYYDYHKPLQAEIPGLENFTGDIVHPQFWPEDLDYSNKRIVVIGSGATAVTLLPNLAKSAARVTMLQRSPGYIVARPNSLGPSWARKYLPRSVVGAWERLSFLVVPHLFYTLCVWFPSLLRAILKAQTVKQLPERISFDPHFKPMYNPWEQRLCLAPDGDFYQALREDRADIVTSRIRDVGEGEIRLLNGRTLEADIIVTATGLRVQFGGNIAISCDGEPIKLPEKALWNGCMIQDVPNMVYMMGYTNAAWTLGADNTAFLLCRLLRQMEKNRANVVVPRAPEGFQAKASPLNLSSTYVKLALDQLPKCGTDRPWKPRTNFIVDHVHARWGDIMKGLDLST